MPAPVAAPLSAGLPAARSTPRGAGTAASGAIPVLYVAGMPRSGSTLLDLMLGQLPGHCDVGELFYMWQAGPLRDQRCGCGEVFSACPFWTEVGRVAFGGWDRVDVREVLQLQASVDKTVYLPLILAARLFPSYQRRLDQYMALLTTLYAAIRQVSGATVVIDSTKRPSLAYILRRTPGVDLALVHIVRDPRGVVTSWSREVALPEGAGPRSHLRRQSPVLISRRWLTVNAMIGMLERLGVPRVLLRYEDLVRRPSDELRRVARLHGDALRADDLDFLSTEGLHLSSSHTVAGGRVRFQTGVVPLRTDERWRTEMSARQRRFVEVVTWPLRRRYGYR